jgi:hypothetical protein
MSRARAAVAAVVIGAVSLAGPGARAQEGPAPEPVGIAVTVGGVDAVVAVAGAAAAVADIVADQALVGNRVEDHNPGLRAHVEQSLRNNVGIVSVNQNAGSVNNQANVRVLALVGSASDLAAVLHLADIAGAAVRTGNTAISTGASREDLLVGSFDGSVGVAGLNQSAGNLNQQANLLALTFGHTGPPGEVVALQDAALGVVSGDNVVDDRVATRTDQIADSFRGFRGVAQVSQVSGDLNVVRNAMTLSVTWTADSLAPSVAVPLR